MDRTPHILFNLVADLVDTPGRRLQHGPCQIYRERLDTNVICLFSFPDSVRSDELTYVVRFVEDYYTLL